MKITIEKVNNGYIVRSIDEEGDIVYVYSETGTSEIRTLQEVLFGVLEEFGYFGCKYDIERLNIKLSHGFDYECKDPECKICTELLEEAYWTIKNNPELWESVKKECKKWE